MRASLAPVRGFRDNAGMQWLKQLFQRRVPHIPDPLWRDCVRKLDFLARLPAADVARLKALSERLLAKKTFTGAGGLELDDATAVLIAAQASLPVLNLTLDLYRDMAGIIVYPAAFIIPQSEIDDAGVVHEWHEPVSGEAIDAGGAVVLSWEDAQHSDTPGYNLVIHEFAHKIDMGNGAANGCPPLLSGYHKDIAPARWRHCFSDAYQDFVQRVERLEARLPEDYDDDNPDHAAYYDELAAELPLDPYAAKHPAEFFAVASEAFFVLPQGLAREYPEAFRMLGLYYLQNPL
jgi:Mlc titration factor MtfA (ptsG expression regulator)